MHSRPHPPGPGTGGLALGRITPPTRLLVVLVCLVGLTACAGVTSRSPDERMLPDAQRAVRAQHSGHYAEAAAAWQRAAATARAQGRDAAAARFLVSLADVEEEAGLYREALRDAAEGLAVAQRAGDRGVEAGALNTLGRVSRRLANYSQALEQLGKARAVGAALGDRGLESESLRTTGAVWQDLGDYDQAQRHYEQALALARGAGDRTREAKALNDLGGLHRLRADYARARRYYEQSLRLRQESGDRYGEGTVLGNLCLLYQNLRDFGRARDYCERSLALARRTGDRALEANALNNLGAVYRGQGDYREALAYYQRSAALKRTLPDRAGAARTLNNLGELYQQMGRPREALAPLSASLKLKREIGDLAGEGAAEYNLGRVYLQLHDLAQARAHFERALALQGAGGQPEIAWRALDGLSQVYAAQSNPRLAILFGKQAVNTLQSVRAGIQGMAQGLQRSFLQDKRQVYRRLAGLLIDQGRLPEAQQVLAMLKEEEYFDFIRRTSPQDPRATQASYGKDEARALQRYEELSRRVIATRSEYSALVSQAQRTPQDEARMQALAADLERARKDLNQWLQDLRKEFETGPGARAIEFGRKDLDSLSGLRTVLRDLGHRAVLVHYLVTDDRLRMIVTGPDPAVPPVHRDDTIARTELHRLLFAYREKLQHPGQDPMPEARALYRHLVGPIQADLDGYGAETLMVYLDEALRYLPLAALHDGREYLAQRYALVMYTAAAKDKLRGAPESDWRAAGLGVSEAAEGFPPLPAVLDELHAIIREGDSGATGVLPGRVYLDGAFTDEALRDALYARYPVVHLASHFRLAPGDEADSFLLLGKGARLSLADLRDKDFPLGDVDLLTLSACETALGGAGADGAEVESFGALAQQQGAKAVLATLWSVPDRSTARFMERFYRLHQQGLTKAEALQKTQLAFIRGEVSAADAGERGRVIHGPGTGSVERSGGPSYAHPYYWAPFVLMGNWL